MARTPKSSSERAPTRADNARAAVNHLRQVSKEIAEPERRGYAEETVNLSVRIPKTLYDQLMSDAGTGGLSAEIRRRLTASFERDVPAAGDPKTQAAIRAIAWALTQYRDPRPDRAEIRWYDDPAGYAVMAATVRKILEHFRPTGSDETAGAREEGMADAFAMMALALWTNLVREGGLHE
jgi:hypothetical protein